ncbi:MAG: hypothetical protein J6A01_12070 [Proteobacteria bacterium]|nr:hypothetical protein [Pseudomonadota bacterium]
MRNRHILSLFILFFIAIVMTSCASLTTMQTAGVVPEGQVRWAIASTGTGGEGDTKPSADPNFEAAVRYGIAENVDVGLKLDLLGAQVGAKYQFMRGDFDAAVGIEAGYQWVRNAGTDDPSSHVIQLQVPVLMEKHFNPYVGLAFGPKLLGIVIAATDNREDIWKDSGLYVGWMFGLPLRLTEGIWFQPEFNIYTNLYSTAFNDENTDTKKRNYISTVLWQAGVSVFFGGL